MAGGKHSFPPVAASKGGQATAQRYGGWHGAHAHQQARKLGLPPGAPAVGSARPLGGVVTPHAIAKPSVGSVLSALRGQARTVAAVGPKVTNLTHAGSPARTTPRTTRTPHVATPRAPRAPRATTTRPPGAPRVGGTRRKAG